MTALVTLAAAIALVLVTLMAFGGRGPTMAHAAVTTEHVVTARDADTLQVGDQTSPDPTGSAAKTAGATDRAGNSQVGGVDGSSANDPGGNSQAGGPDTGASSGEAGVDSEQGQAGEPAVGQADPAGAAGSNCTGNCVQ